VNSSAFPERSISRRRFLTAAIAAVPITSIALGDDPESRDVHPSRDMITPEAQTAIDRGLEYLARSQQPDGAWGDRALYQGNLAVVSLGGLAFLAGGNHPSRGPNGKTVTRAIQFILAHEQSHPAGFLHNPIGNTHGPMYSHGFATMFLAEAHGTIDDRDLRRRVRDVIGRAVQVILNSQNGDGGWRYQPYREQVADISVTICQIMALRSARNAGIEVPKSAVDDCIKFVKNCKVQSGGFRYFKSGGPPAFARSAAGVVALYSAGVYSGKEIDDGIRYLMQYKPNGQAMTRREDVNNYYYGHYYAALAMWTAGGRFWREWFPAIREELLSRNRLRSEGAWTDLTVGSDYATAMACIILQIPNNYLPIMQK
jgi:hypothetical protein